MQGLRYQETDGRFISEWVHEIFDLETGIAYPFKPRLRGFFVEGPVAVAPDNLHIIFRSVVQAENPSLYVLRIKDFTEVLRFPLPSEFKAISNITSEGRFAVLTAANELLRLQLHLPSQAIS